MGKMVFDRSLCYIPANTLFEEKHIRCKGDIVISDRSIFRRGMITEGRIFVGEFVELRGDIASMGDIRLDKGTRYKGDMTGDGDIVIGERSIVQGNINVGKDLDIGEGVQLDPSTIDSKGFINIRNPISSMIYLLLYLLQMLKTGDSTQIDTLLSDLENDPDETFMIGSSFAFFPRSSTIDGDTIAIPGDVRIGPGSQLVGDIEAQGRVEIERDVQLFGDIKAKGDVYLGENVVINGRIQADGDVTIHHAARIGGDVLGNNVLVTSDTIIEGTMKGISGVQVLTEDKTMIDDEGAKRGRLNIVGAIEDLES
jgi:predicted acyltransferase (DUF342 family)